MAEIQVRGSQGTQRICSIAEVLLGASSDVPMDPNILQEMRLLWPHSPKLLYLPWESFRDIKCVELANIIISDQPRACPNREIHKTWGLGFNPGLTGSRVDHQGCCQGLDTAHSCHPQGWMEMGKVGTLHSTTSGYARDTQGTAPEKRVEDTGLNRSQQVF